VSIVYYSVRQYLESCTSLQAKINGLETVLANMIVSYASAAAGDSFQPYRFDDGQTKIELLYQSPEAMSKAIKDLQNLVTSLRAQQFNNANGRVMRMVPGENFIGGFGNGC
jgi:hypothetical protein